MSLSCLVCLAAPPPSSPAWGLPSGASFWGSLSSGTAIYQLGEPQTEILRYASFAPSGHNAQSWQVTAKGPNRWILSLDPQRLLPEVDPKNREAMLSLGHFIENLAIAAGSKGVETDVEVLAEGGRDREVARIHLTSGAPVDYPLRRLSRRGTLRSGFSPETLTRSDLEDLLAPFADAGTYFPRGSREASWLQEAAVEAIREQTWRDPAQQELSN